MKVLLINPGVPGSLKKENLGLAYLAATLIDSGHRVQIADEVVGHRVEEALDAFAPDVAGVSFMTMAAPRAYAIARDIRRTRGIPLFAGGAHPSALPEEALEHFDCAVRGEAEWTLPRLLDSGRFQGIVEAEPPHDLDALPMPRRDLLNLEAYASSDQQLAGFSLRTLGAITSRGCPYRCIFCVNSKRESALRFHSPERVIEEIQYLVTAHRIQSIAFYDELIATDAQRFRALCEAMIQKDLNHLRWECQMHPRTVRQDVLALMRDAGCIQIAVGFESGSQWVLDTIGKNVTVEQNLEVARRVRESGLRLRACFVIGTPGETLEDIAETERFIRQAHVDFASIHYLTPMPGTVLFDQFADEIRGSGIPWDTFTAGNPDTFVCNRAISAAEQKEAFLRMSARLAFRNYSWGEMVRRAIREPGRALHVAARALLPRPPGR